MASACLLLNLTLIERAEDPNDLNGYNKEGGGVIRIERTGIF